MSDYTPRKEDEAFALPPLPLFAQETAFTPLVESYGHACAEAARAPLIRDLAECFNAGGSDADGNGDDWRAANAVRCVRQLRADYDEACDEGEKLRARIAELEKNRAMMGGHNAYLEEKIAELEISVKTFQTARDHYRNDCFELSEENRHLRDEVEALRKAGGTLATAVYNATGIVGLLNSAQRECLNNARIRWDAIAARKGAEGDRLGEGSEPPANCRQRLAAEGKAYPRSRCEACGQFAPLRPECDALLEAKRAAQRGEGE